MSKTDAHIHIVRHGEYANDIVKKYGLTVDQLQKINLRVLLRKLIAGMRINTSSDPAHLPSSPTSAFIIASDINAVLKSIC
ncbi:MAG: LysM domain-containing protein [Bacteroidota bacterium]